MQPSTELTPRSPRVRFPRDVRVVPIGGPPRAYRLRATNLSKEGVFLTMTRPLEEGTRVALSLEASGLVLPFAQGEIVRRQDPMMAGTLENGVAVRFTDFLHPRAGELVSYLVDTLQSGKPLQPAKPVAKWKRRAGMTAGVVGLTALTAAVVLGAAIFWKESRKAQGATADRVAQKVAEEGDDEAAVASAEAVVATTSPVPKSADVAKAPPEPGVEAKAPKAEAPTPTLAAESPELAEVKAAAKAAAHAEDVIAAEQGTAANLAPDEQADRAHAASEDATPSAQAAAGIAGTDDQAGRSSVAADEPVATPATEKPAAHAEPESAERNVAAAEAKAAGAESKVAAESTVAAAEAKAAGAEPKVAAEPRSTVVEPKAAAKRSEAGPDAPPRARAQATQAAATPSSEHPATAATSAPKSLTQTVADETRDAALELSAKHATKSASAKPAAAPRSLSLPSGAVASLSWSATKDSLRIEPKLASGSSMEKVFLLEHPSRLVFDVAGTAPKKSVTLKVGSGPVDKVRLGKQGASTRIVVDLEQAPAKLTQKDGAALLTF